jgi:hypothetical protein
LAALQEWYASQCDGNWEHRYGVKIGTIDNPGWSLCIDLDGTGLADVVFPELRENYDELEWLICTKHVSQFGIHFGGNGGPRQLGRMIEIFLAWAEANRPREPSQPAA